MSTWPVSEAKAKLSEVLRRCQKEPQTITVRGVAKAQMISIAEYLRLGGKMSDFAEQSAASVAAKRGRGR